MVCLQAPRIRNGPYFSGHGPLIWGGGPNLEPDPFPIFNSPIMPATHAFFIVLTSFEALTALHFRALHRLLAIINYLIKENEKQTSNISDK